MNTFYKLITVLTLASVMRCELKTSECDRMPTKYGFVCKCTETYCDYLENPVVKDENSWILITSSKRGLRFSQLEGVFDSSGVYVQDDNYEEDLKNLSSKFDVDTVALDLESNWWKFYTKRRQNYYTLTPRECGSSATITINRSRTYQHIVGFGGALTGAVAYLFNNLKPKAQEQLLKTYFHQDGIGYNMLRTTIGGCDFDLLPWAYNEHPRNDQHLSNFTQLDPRDLLIVEQIGKIQALTGAEKLKIMAAAYSPPPWMKSNKYWIGTNNLRREYYKTWALYHLKYLELMQAENITIWAISTGNEPLNGIVGLLDPGINSLGWLAVNQAIYLDNYLGPLMKESEFKDVLIFGNDGHRFTFPLWFEKMNASRPNSLNYIDGLAVHWRWENDFSPKLNETTMTLMPGRILLNTKSCVGDKPWEKIGPQLGSWDRAELYIASYLEDFQHHFNGYIDWNLMLNERGGPNYRRLYVDAPIVVNTTNYSEFYKQPVFYAIGHFSKFLHPNSKRIDLNVTSLHRTLRAVGFIRPDGTIVVIIFNKAPNPQQVTVRDSVRGNIAMYIPANSIHTMLYK